MCPHYSKYHTQIQLGEYQLATCGLPGATSCHKISQRCRRVTLLISAWWNISSGGALQGLAVRALLDCFMSPRTAGPALPCLHSPYSSAPMAHAGCTAPVSTAGAAASPHCAANAATLMQNKEYTCTRQRASGPVPAPPPCSPVVCVQSPSGNRAGAVELGDVLSADFQRFKNRHNQPPTRRRTLSESHPRLVKRMHSIIGAALADGEQGEERPLALLRPCVVKWRNNFLYALSHSHMIGKIVKRNLKRVPGRALNWWKKTWRCHFYPS